jgi:hypothetical protein
LARVKNLKQGLTLALTAILTLSFVAIGRFTVKAESPTISACATACALARRGGERE